MALLGEFFGEKQHTTGGGGGSAAVGVIPWRVLAAIHGAPLQRARSEIISAAYAQISRLTADGRAYSPPGTPHPRLEDVYKLREASGGYSNHPDVKAGKRTPEDVEKEFLTCFSAELVGDEYVSEAASSLGGSGGQVLLVCGKG